MADAYGAILGAASELATGLMSSIPYLIPTESDKSNTRRLKELKRLAELNALGLTEEEKQAYFTSLNNAVGGARQQAASQMEAGLQSFGGSGGGKALQLAKAGEEAAGRISGDIQQKVLQEDIGRRDQMRQELEDRAAYKSMRDQQKAAAMTSILMPVLGSMSESGAMKQSVEGNKKKPEETEAEKQARIEAERQANADAYEKSYGSGSDTYWGF